MAAKHIVLSFGYGCHLVPELTNHLDRMVEFGNREKPDCWMFSGGFTQQKTAPFMSEARLMKEYVISRLKYSPELVYAEEDSYTTPDNAKNSADKIRAEKLMNHNTKVTVWCEATRALKVDDAIRYCMGRRATIETSSWELMSPTKQIISTLYDYAAVRFSPLATFFRNQRIKRAQNI